MIKIFDFYADWCGPCKMIAPILEEINKEFPQILIQKFDVDADVLLAGLYDVRSIPTLIFYKNDIEKFRLTGFTSKQKIIDIINKIT